jgi:hypothetical protein
MDFKKPFPYCFFDPPLMLDCAITHIPGNTKADKFINALQKYVLEQYNAQNP